MLYFSFASDGAEVTTAPKTGSSNNTLQRKLQELEEEVMCTICMERKRDLVFLCGHSVCAKCGDNLRTCHMCRKPIGKKIPLYS